MRDAPATTVRVRRTDVQRRTAQAMAVCSLALVTWMALPAPAHAAVPARPGHVLLAEDVTKFYVVRSPQENGGKPDTLFDIAQRTLGDGNRFEEILVLNSGRLLPDGSVFVSPDQLQPGFALILPEDAAGSGVQVGVLPQSKSTGSAGSAGSGQNSSTAAASTAPAKAAKAAKASGPLAAVSGKVPLPLLAGGIAGVTTLTVTIVARRPLGLLSTAVGAGHQGGGARLGLEGHRRPVGRRTGH
ncbi:hypothetical protein ABZ887_23950, partial [Streptomyces sp. NPDC047061]